MIIFLTLAYVGLLFLLTKTGKVPNTRTTWLSIIPYLLVLLIAFFIPMQWGAPTGPARVMRYSVAVVPNVVGIVTEVVAEPNQPLKKGDVLFRIDPTQYQAERDGLVAQLQLAETRLGQTRKLAAAAAGSRFEVEAYEAQVKVLRAQIANAEWNLKETVVRAPADGYVTNVTLRPGTRVANAPSAATMAFIDTTELGVMAQVHQIHTRFIQPGQKAEVTFKTRPGTIYPATVRFLVPATSRGQAPVSGAAAAAQPFGQVPAGPFSVRLDLDDPEAAASLLPGARGEVAIYTDEMSMTHIIRKVMIRMDSLLNYVSPA